MNFFLTRWAGFESFERLESLGLRRALTSWRCWTGLRHWWRKILGVIRVWILLDWSPTEATDSQVEFRIGQCQSKVLPEFRTRNFFFLIPFWLNLICRSLIFALLTCCCVSHPFPVYKVSCPCGCFLHAASCWECAFWRAGHKSLWSRLMEVRRSLFWTWILSSNCLLRIYWKCLDCSWVRLESGKSSMDYWLVQFSEVQAMILRHWITSSCTGRFWRSVFEWKVPTKLQTGW